MIVLTEGRFSSDLDAMKENIRFCQNGSLCSADRLCSQKAIDKKLTLIAWEAMFKWSNAGEKLMHVFYRNNEIAGYAAVHHALSLYGMDGNYGNNLSAGIISYGSVSRGVINALKLRGYHDIMVYSRRPSEEIKDKQLNISFKRFFTDGNEIFIHNENGVHTPFIDHLSKHDIICNGILQNPLAPINFITRQNLHKIKDNALIIDISCDEGMGFFFARPTSFKDPSFLIERNIKYYAVDHVPSFLHEAASYEISIALLPYLKVIHGGPKACKNNETISKAIEIQDGIILNPAILKFQKREEKWPYKIKNQNIHV